MAKSIIQQMIDDKVFTHQDVEKYLNEYNKKNKKQNTLIEQQAKQVEQAQSRDKKAEGYSKIENGVLIKFDERDLDRYGHYKMPMEVYEIGKYAFSNCKKVRTVILSPDVRYIAERAFFNCGLQFIDLCNVKSIGECAFSFCLNLQEVEISQHLKSVGGAIFYNCINLKNFIIPIGNTIVLKGCKWANRSDAQDELRAYIKNKGLYLKKCVAR